MFKNLAGQKLAIYAWDGGAGAPKTGDADNITAYVSKDGGSAAVLTDTNPTELDATNLPGVYAFDLSQGETDGDLLCFSPKSSTEGVVIHASIIYTGGSVDGLPPHKALRLLLAALAGKTSGGGTDTIVFRDVGDAKDRIAVTVDSNRNRTSVSIDAD